MGISNYLYIKTSKNIYLTKTRRNKILKIYSLISLKNLLINIIKLKKLNKDKKKGFYISNLKKKL